MSAPMIMTILANSDQVPEVSGLAALESWQVVLCIGVGIVLTALMWGAIWLIVERQDSRSRERAWADRP